MLLEVANTIAEQIGARAFLMMGTRVKVGDSNSLTFDIRGCPKINKIRITLIGDLYTVTFYKSRGLEIVIVSELEGVYADMLHGIIEEETGLRLKL